MAKHMINTSAAPAALGTYSQGIRAGGTLYLSGQLGLDPATGNLATSIDAQIEQAFQNLRAVASAGGVADGGRLRSRGHRRPALSRERERRAGPDMTAGPALT